MTKAVQTHRLRFALLVMTAVCTVDVNPSWSIVVSDHTQDYIVQPGQPKYGVKLDGVVALGIGAVGNTSLQDITVFNCTGALISDRHILTAAHCLDTDYNGELDSQVSGFGYYAGFQLADRELVLKVDIAGDPWPSSWPYAIEGLNVAAPDIAVLHLIDPAPPEVPRYKLYGGSAEIGHAAVLTGYGTTGYGDTGIGEVPNVATVKRAGLNRFDSFLDELELEIGFDFDSGDPAHNVFALLGQESDLGLGADEVMTAFGDSGGPLFIDGVIAGVIAFNVSRDDADFNDEFDQSWGEAAFATRVSSFRDFITTATNGQAVFVPESQSSFVWSVFVVGQLLRLRKRRQAFWTG